MADRVIAGARIPRKQRWQRELSAPVKTLAYFGLDRDELKQWKSGGDDEGTSCNVEGRHLRADGSLSAPAEDTAKSADLER